MCDVEAKGGREAMSDEGEEGKELLTVEIDPGIQGAARAQSKPKYNRACDLVLRKTWGVLRNLDCFRSTPSTRDAAATTRRCGGCGRRHHTLVRPSWARSSTRSARGGVTGGITSTSSRATPL